MAYSYYREWAPYVPVAKRRQQAQKKLAQLRKKGVNIQPVEIAGRSIARTFWGQAWCDHIESLGDYANRLPRGRTYVRNGSVCHLAIEKGRVAAMVSGSHLYNVDVRIDVLPQPRWRQLKSGCADQIGSLLELLQGRLSDHVMQAVTNAENGLFPRFKEIRLGCSCPDGAVMCKHVAAVLYGVGARLDEQPELLFLLRGVKHEELVATRAETAVSRATRRGGKRPTLAAGELEDVFGISIDTETRAAPTSDEPRSVGRSRKGAPTQQRNVGQPRRKTAAGRRSTASAAVNKTGGGPTSKVASQVPAAKSDRPKNDLRKRVVKKSAVQRRGKKILATDHGRKRRRKTAAVESDPRAGRGGNEKGK